MDTSKPPKQLKTAADFHAFHEWILMNCENLPPVKINALIATLRGIYRLRVDGPRAYLQIASRLGKSAMPFTIPWIEEVIKDGAN
jgi:hypothetical protein